jgi:hypothetical protein
MPLILGANSLAGGGYEIDNSLRFNSGSSDYLSKTFGIAGNRQIFTISFWFKKVTTGVSNGILINGQNTGNDDFSIYNNTNDKIQIFSWNASSEQFTLSTTQVLRDVSAWYHMVVACDTTQATASNRVKLYLNGSQITSFDTANYPSLNANLNYNTTDPYWIGRSYGSTYNNKYLSEFYSIDGQALDPTSFGEFDEDSGIWKPIAYTGTYGTNGFFLEFKDSSALGDDTSGNSNDFTVNNLTSADQTTDTPTNNFATLNPLGFAGTIPTFSQGNLNVVCGSGVSLYSVSTIGVSSGKWYVEGEIEEATPDGGLYYIDFGFADRADSAGTSLYVTNPGRFFFHSSWNGSINYRTNGSNTVLLTSLATFVPGDFFQLYLDMDNELMYWGKNGSLLNSTGVSFNGKESLTGEYFFAFGDQFTSGTNEYAVNFGQGSIDGVGVSAYQDVNGFGSFKYNPTVTTDEGSKDFLALCTKNLAEYG